MKMPKFIKLVLASAAFVSGAVVAQYLQPLTGPAGGLEQSLLVARADAALKTEQSRSKVAVPQANTYHSDIQNQREPSAPQTAAVGFATPTPLGGPPVDDEQRKQIVRKSILTAPSSRQQKRAVPPTTQKPPQDREQVGRRLSLTALTSLSDETDYRTIRLDLPGQFKPLHGTLEKRSTAKKLTARRPSQVVSVAEREPHPIADTASETEFVAASVSAPSGFAGKGDPAPPVHDGGESESPASVAEATEGGNADDKDQETDLPLVTKPAATSLSPEPSLSPGVVALGIKVQRVLDMYRQQEISVREKSAWSVMHSLIGYGVEKKVRVDHTGKRASAIGWICYNNPCRGVRLFYLKNDRIHGRLGPGNQGHEGQFLAMLAQSRVHMEYPMKIGGRDFTVADLVEREKESCRLNTELTFKLIGLAHYLEIDETWKDDRGGKWSIPRLITEEMRQPIIGAACGGTHRLFGLSYAINRRVHKGKSIDGEYRRAHIYLKDYHKYTFKMQNPDGSFSTQFFSGRGASPDEARRLLTTGHISEWLAFSLNHQDLSEPNMVRAIDYLAELLLRGRKQGWDVGPLGHALHALNIYHQRVFSSELAAPAIAANR